jgi:hypothetical protein
VSATWWPAKWGYLGPGDLVQAPDGSAWTVTAALQVSANEGEWCITNGRASAWTAHRMDEPVNAQRPAAAREPDELARGEAVLGRLRMAFGEVEVLQASDIGPADGARWLRCGRRGKCVCR